MLPKGFLTFMQYLKSFYLLNYFCTKISVSLNINNFLLKTKEFNNCGGL